MPICHFDLSGDIAVRLLLPLFMKKEALHLTEGPDVL